MKIIEFFKNFFSKKEYIFNGVVTDVDKTLGLMYFKMTSTSPDKQEFIGSVLMSNINFPEVQYVTIGAPFSLTVRPPNYKHWNFTTYRELWTKEEIIDLLNNEDMVALKELWSNK